MKLEQSFEVAAPLERVWQTLIDVEHVAPCLPGAAITGRNEDGSYSGTFTIKIGPTTASYSGKLAMDQVDESAHTATMQAQGTDKRGQGGAKATIVSRLTSEGSESTRVEVDTDYHITGRLARFGRGGMIEDISERLLREFASRLQASLVSPAERGSGAGGGSAAASGSGPAADPMPAPTEVAPEDEPAPLRSDDEAARLQSDELGDDESPPLRDEDEPDGTALLRSEAPVADEPAPPREARAAETVPSMPAQPASEPIEGLSLVGSVMLNRVRRNPAPLFGVLAALLVLFLLRRRSS